MTSRAAKSSCTSALARTGLEPRGLSREQAAAYLGIGPTLFDDMVSDGRMPDAKAIGSRRVWDRRALDEAFDKLPPAGAAPPQPANDSTAAPDVWGQARV